MSKALTIACSFASNNGCDINFFNLYELNISYCKGCKSCNKSGLCMINDDAAKLQKSIRECDLVIIAAPVYWANVPAPVKNLFDRLVGTAMNSEFAIPKPKLSPKQKYLLLTSCDTPFPFSVLAGQSTGALRAMREFFKTSGMKSLGSITIHSAKKINDIPEKYKYKIERYLTKWLCEK